MSQQKRAVQTEDFTRLQVYSDPQLLQNEHAFLFVSTTINEDKNYEAHIHHYDLDKKQSKQWSFGKSKNNNPRVSPDGTQIVFQSNRSGTTQLWLLQVDGGEAKQLTTFKNGATNPHWTPDGKGIIFTARLEENEDVHHQKELSKEERKKEQDEKNKEPLVVSKLKYKADGVGFLDNKRSQIMLYHLTDGSIEQLTTGDADHHFQDISPNGETILFAGNLNKDADYELITDLFTLDITSKSITKLTDGNGSYFQASFSPDGKESPVSAITMNLLAPHKISYSQLM
ncbi:TolB family protein [Paracerasibacillus soli]|uniref:Uncharacterized protein n=1 Tax=Paracerasibacillus soli TaxID=480284 RepID=A0ABU5CN24_9BACI|nr:hypothetical protein [Virgibacillus soli]MDY0407766.1 hypothetical protein [Virgibacillus soli]